MYRVCCGSAPDFWDPEYAYMMTANKLSNVTYLAKFTGPARPKVVGMDRACEPSGNGRAGAERAGAERAGAERPANIPEDA